MNFTETIKELPITQCTHAYPGTYGHECGKPATLVAAFKLPTDRDWVGGIYYGGRCHDCAKANTPDNRKATIEPLNGQVNKIRIRAFENEAKQED